MPHVLELWLGVSKGMLPVIWSWDHATCLRAVVGSKQGHVPCGRVYGLGTMPHVLELWLGVSKGMLPVVEYMVLGPCHMS